MNNSHGECFYCGCPLDSSSFTKDHIVPRRQGGISSKNNLAPCCKSCNSSKGGKSLEEFRFQIAFQKHPYREAITASQALRMIELGCRIDVDRHVFHFEKQLTECE